ncbi:forkhead box protein C2-B [Biomphalaria glabrata]|nr:forkhead box protein C2-B [Biomphalaria glabrata]
MSYYLSSKERHGICHSKKDIALAIQRKTWRSLSKETHGICHPKTCYDICHRQKDIKLSSKIDMAFITQKHIMAFVIRRKTWDCHAQKDMANIGKLSSKENS